MSQEAQLVVTQEQGISIVNFAKPTLMDSYHVSQVEKEMTVLIEKGHLRKIVLDFSVLQMLSSRALGVLLTIRQKLEPLGGKIVICGIDPKLYRVFKITNLQSVFDFYDDRASAIEALKEQE